METTLGGDRLGSGNKQKVHLRNYERSTHDLGYIWRSTMSAGTIVPFLSKVMLPGDNWDVNLNCEVLTHPTIGPLFGSFKVQLDVFQIPIRLYVGLLHMNAVNIGLEMNKVLLPQMQLRARPIDVNKAIDNQQINPSCIFHYLGIKGLGSGIGSDPKLIYRPFNAIPYLAYWDIYKAYYANKQEEIGMVIHSNFDATSAKIHTVLLQTAGGDLTFQDTDYNDTELVNIDPTAIIQVYFSTYEQIDISRIQINVNGYLYNLEDLFMVWQWNDSLQTLFGSIPSAIWMGNRLTGYYRFNEGILDPTLPSRPTLRDFPLSNIDEMRKLLLKETDLNSTLTIGSSSLEPYSWPMQIFVQDDEPKAIAMQGNQEGLAIKTYQSDLFNNWISTEWIDGDGGINDITKVAVIDDSFTIDSLILSRKIYDMLNRIAISGGTYDDWLDATYTHERRRGIENPVYIGGLIKELTFQEVVSTGAADINETAQPLGTLAGRGRLTNKHKGGYIEARADEPSYIMGMVSLTPRIDYSQGNSWDMNLDTVDDFHKPALDEIGFQDLITDQLAWWDTQFDGGLPKYSSAGKQPAWINYMTSVNECHGNFADAGQQMWMTLNRYYEPLINPDDKTARIKDLTTYIDPSKFNNIFADTRLDAQNFWVQISVDITARRKMSAKIIPNL